MLLQFSWPSLALSLISNRLWIMFLHNWDSTMYSAVLPVTKQAQTCIHVDSHSHWKSHGNKNWWHNWEWEWEGMGITLYMNGNGLYPMGINLSPDSTNSLLFLHSNMQIGLWQFRFWRLMMISGCSTSCSSIMKIWQFCFWWQFCSTRNRIDIKSRINRNCKIQRQTQCYDIVLCCPSLWYAMGIGRNWNRPVGIPWELVTKLGMGMGGNGNWPCGNRREWECKKPFPIISTVNSVEVRNRGFLYQRMSWYSVITRCCSTMVFPMTPSLLTFT